MHPWGLCIRAGTYVHQEFPSIQGVVWRGNGGHGLSCSLNLSKGSKQGAGAPQKYSRLTAEGGVSVAYYYNIPESAQAIVRGVLMNVPVALKSNVNSLRNGENYGR